MPMFMFNTSPEMKAKFDEPDYILENEVMLRDKFSEYFKVKDKFKLLHFLLIVLLLDN